ncbi:putative polysaccharide polymerase protein [Thermoclostridium stercorarium subsp. stercorarium DSM 8532]|uniref:Putative polysaccharide polymerase protein n=1 Tax=Thermoclostridium stercorarium (strain ATCC 35414 / DSM 8532 / NCIMB 11754) TaxID=1121335 RepID=L7VKJ0_THES1|nr:EpsG family protein [Thermoclostridium stercorarium]AGC67174.1 putative polysaccharide polymerase protein [Thermoclostridium stercorarium subsp. stercorarium DSM 8532]AGI38251.1 hypothetical protein Clst_0139 [Thermoclostridium stercorarium subsp. stercorarium DSM 8532]
MGIYYILLVIILLEAVLIFLNGSSNKKKKIYLYLVFLKLFIISAFRSANIGNDTETYIDLFNRLGQAESLFSVQTRYEIGFVLLNRIVYFFNSNSQAIIIVTSFIILYLFLTFIYKESSIAWLSVYLFITLRYFYATMNTIRFCLAMGIIFVSFKYLKERKIIPFSITVIIATCFHTTAIIFLIAYPIVNLKFNRKNFILLSIAAIIGFVAFNPLLDLAFTLFPQYKHYLTSSYFKGNRLANYILFLINFVILTFSLIIVKRNKKQLIFNENLGEDSEVNILLYIMTLGTIFSFMAIRASLLDRVASYFSVFSIILIPKIIKMVKNKYEKSIYVYLIMFFTLLYHTVIFIYRPEWNIVFPYEFFWRN